jgi:hypothetical protein
MSSVKSLPLSLTRSLRLADWRPVHDDEGGAFRVHALIFCGGQSTSLAIGRTSGSPVCLKVD